MKNLLFFFGLAFSLVAQIVPRPATSYAGTNILIATNAADLARMNAFPRYVSSLADLATTSSTAGPSSIIVTDSLRGGLFVHAAAATYTTNTGTVFDNPGGQWVRYDSLKGGPVNPQWFGAIPDDATSDRTAFLRALELNRGIVLPDGEYTFSGPTTHTNAISNFSIQGSPGKRTRLVYNGSMLTATTSYFLWADLATNIDIRNVVIEGGASFLRVTNVFLPNPVPRAYLDNVHFESCRYGLWHSTTFPVTTNFVGQLTMNRVTANADLAVSDYAGSSVILASQIPVMRILATDCHLTNISQPIYSIDPPLNTGIFTEAITVRDSSFRGVQTNLNRGAVRQVASTAYATTVDNCEFLDSPGTETSDSYHHAVYANSYHTTLINNFVRDFELPGAFTFDMKTSSRDSLIANNHFEETRGYSSGKIKSSGDRLRLINNYFSGQVIAGTSDYLITCDTEPNYYVEIRGNVFTNISCPILFRDSSMGPNATVIFEDNDIDGYVSNDRMVYITGATAGHFASVSGNRIRNANPDELLWCASPFDIVKVSGNVLVDQPSALEVLLRISGAASVRVQDNHVDSTGNFIAVDTTGLRDVWITGNVGRTNSINDVATFTSGTRTTNWVESANFLGISGRYWWNVPNRYSGTAVFSSASTSNPLNLSQMNCQNQLTYYNTTGTINLPVGLQGMRLRLISAGSHTITLNPQDDEYIRKDGVQGAAGEAMVWTATIGQYVQLYNHGGEWIFESYTGTIAEETP